MVSEIFTYILLGQCFGLSFGQSFGDTVSKLMHSIHQLRRFVLAPLKKKTQNFVHYLKY